MKKKADMVIKIGGMDIDVFFIPGDGEAFGDFTYLQCQIRVDNRLEGAALVDTLIHEVLHAIYAMGKLKNKAQSEDELEEQEERVVSVMATYLTQVLRDNPHLVRWINKNLL